MITVNLCNYHGEQGFISSLFFFFSVLQYYFRCTPSVYKSKPKWYTESVQTKSLDPEENHNQLLFYSFHQLADLLRKKTVMLLEVAI